MDYSGYSKNCAIRRNPEGALSDGSFVDFSISLKSDDAAASSGAGSYGYDYDDITDIIGFAGDENYAENIKNAYLVTRYNDYETKYHVMNKTNITVCTCVYIYIYIYLCVCVCVCVCKGRSIPNHVTFGLRKMLQNPKSYYLRNLPMYTTPFETPVIIIP